MLKIVVIGIEMRWIGISDSRSRTTSLLSQPLLSLLYDQFDVVQVLDEGLVCLARRMSRELFLSLPNFEAIFAPILTRSCHCGGRFLAHYWDIFVSLPG